VKNVRLPVKGTASRDEIENAWVDLSLSKGRDRFLNFSDVPNSRKFGMSCSKCKTHLVDYVSSVYFNYFVISLALSLVSAACL
jgi:hypothetical protein